MLGMNEGRCNDPTSSKSHNAPNKAQLARYEEYKVAKDKRFNNKDTTQAGMPPADASSAGGAKQPQPKAKAKGATKKTNNKGNDCAVAATVSGPFID